MSTKEMTKAVRRLRELEAEAAQLADQIDTLKEQIKAEMAVRDMDEMQAGVFRVRWTAVQSTRLDSAAFREAMPELYDRFARKIETRRFTVT